MGGGRRVHFPAAAALVSGRLPPPDPWANAHEIPADELLILYEKSCQKHSTQPLQCVLTQIKELGTVGGPTRRGTLKLAGCHLTPEICESLEEIFKKVRFNRINLCDCHLSDDTAVALFDMIEFYESTSELDISSNKGLGILSWQACSRMINKSLWLEQIEIRETSLSESSAPVLGRGLRSPCSLRCLNLQQSHLSGTPLLCLTGFLKINKSVRELHLGDNQLVASDARHLASMLKLNSTLQLLDISNNDIQDAGVEAISEALSEQSSAISSSSESSSESPLSSPQSGYSAPTHERGLAVLIVWNNNLTRNSGNYFSRALSRCRSLEVLNVGQNPLSGETVNRIRSALQQNRSLLSLGMQSTRLGAEAAIALAEVIEDNPVIQRIDLRDNKLQTAGLLALATALKKNQTVTRIDLDDAALPQTDKEQPLEEARLVKEIRSICTRNELQQNPMSLSIDDDDPLSLRRRRAASFTTRKISLTCQTLNTPIEPLLSPPKISSGRLKSPLPSPTPSPASSPIPSPSHRSRFRVSRVNDSSSGTSQSPSPSTPTGAGTFTPGTSRFQVVTVPDPPKISIQQPDDNSKPRSLSTSSISRQIGNSRFRIVRNVELNPNTTRSADNINKIANSAAQNQDKNKSGFGLEFNTFDTIKENIGASHDETKDTKKSSELKVKSSSDDFSNIDEGKSKSSGNIKKNKSESSLDSPDLEVSHFMEDKQKIYDSSSSLDISSCSMESLNTPDTSKNVAYFGDTAAFQDNQKPMLLHCSVDSEESDVFAPTDKASRDKRMQSSNESSLDLSAPVDVPRPMTSFTNQSVLNSSVSSNESVSPNIFGKHMRLYGSVTSLEASVSSLDSYRSGMSTFVESTLHNEPSDQTLVESSDSGIFQSDSSYNKPSTSNDDTLTNNSILSRVVQALSAPPETSNIDSNVIGLLNVPASSKQRIRKTSSIISPENILKKEMEEPQKASGLGKFFNLFQYPTNIFSRSLSEFDKKESGQAQQEPAPSNNSPAFWKPWSMSNFSIGSPIKTAKTDEASKNLSSVSAEFTVKIPEPEENSNIVAMENTGLNRPQANNSDNSVFVTNVSSTDEAVSESKQDTGEIDSHMLNVNDSVETTNRLSFECCDNLDEIENESDTRSESSQFDNSSKDIIAGDEIPNAPSLSIENCDKTKVQFNQETRNVYVEDVTTADSDITDNTVQTTLSSTNAEAIQSVSNGGDGCSNVTIPESKDNFADLCIKNNNLIVDERREIYDLLKEPIVDVDALNDTNKSNDPPLRDPDNLESIFDSDLNESFCNPLYNDQFLFRNYDNNPMSKYEIEGMDSLKDADNAENIHKIYCPILTTKKVLINNYMPDDLSYSAFKPEKINLGDIIDLNFAKKISSTEENSDRSPSVLKQAIGFENRTSPTDRQSSPESGPSVEHLPNKIIRKIKENVSPENTLTPSMSNTQALVQELAECRKSLFVQLNPELCCVQAPVSDIDLKLLKNIETDAAKPEECTLGNPQIGEANNNNEVESERELDVPEPTCDDLKVCDLENDNKFESIKDESGFEQIQEFSPEDVMVVDKSSDESTADAGLSFVEEASDALTIIDSQNNEAVAECNITSALNVDNRSASDYSNTIEPASKPSEEPGAVKPILKNKSDIQYSSPKNIPDKNKCGNSEDEAFARDKNLPVRCGSLPECNLSSHSPKSLPDSLSKKMKSRSNISTLGKLARDSLCALNLSEEEIADLCKCGPIASLESVRSLSSVSEDAGDTFPLRRGRSSSESKSLGPCTSLESLASLASISETTGENEDANISKDPH